MRQRQEREPEHYSNMGEEMKMAAQKRQSASFIDSSSDAEEAHLITSYQKA